MDHQDSDLQNRPPTDDDPQRGVEYRFPVERLDVFKVAVDVARSARRLAMPARDKHHMRDQLIRAVDSCLLNIAEGSTADRLSPVQRNHYRIAMGSACEACAALYVVDTAEAARLRRLLRRIGAMLSAMSR